MTHKTKGIVLRTVAYGDTSIIATIYTELFGLQSYIIKGVKHSSAKKQSKANCFQPAALLELEVYHNELKNLQFIKEVQWHFLYRHIFYDVMKNAVALFVAELIIQTIQQPETNISLYNFFENSLLNLDGGDAWATANTPLFFALGLSKEMGFKIHGKFSETNFILDLQEGTFVSHAPLHPYYILHENAAYISALNQMNDMPQTKNMQLNGNMRRQLIEIVMQYFALHIEGFKEIKSLKVLQEILA